MLAELLSTHDPLRLAMAASGSLVGCLPALALLPPHGAASSPRAVMRTVFAGLALGGTAWCVFLLSLSGYFPFLGTPLPLGSTSLATALALAGGVAAAAISANAASSTRNALLAGSILSSSLSCTLFVAMSGLAAPLPLAYDLPAVLVFMAVGSLICGAALRQVKRASLRGRLLPGVMVALAVPLIDIASFTAILPFSEWEVARSAPDALELHPVAVVFISELLVALALTSAGTAVDRRTAARTARELSRLRQLTESTFEGIVVHRGGVIEDANSAFCALTGRTLDEIMGHSIAEFAPGYDGGASPQPVEVDLLTANGADIPVEMLSRDFAIGDDGTRVVAVRDIRERRAAETSAREHQHVLDLQREAEELKERQRIAEAASRAKSAFLAMMSHEIRTPMNGVLGLASALLDAGLPDEQRKLAAAIGDSGESLMHLLNDVLDFSKLDAGYMVLESSPFSPQALIEDAVSVYGAQAAAKGIGLRAEFVPPLPALLLGDASRLRQVVHNLVSNAVKFTERGEVVLQMCCRNASLLTTEVELAVRDTGIGIPADKIGTLFDAFVQADSSITRRFGGSGLGLAICRQLVELMRGRIEVESSPEQGSTFRVLLQLPRARREPAPSPVTASTEALAGQLATLGRPLRLLLAEDSPTNQFVLLQLVKGLPIETDIANDGREAVAAAERNAYDMICMDMRMPEMDGLEATRRIRSGDGPSRNTPIVAMTANASREDMAACREAGMTDFVSKPITKQTVQATILRAISETAPA